MPFHQFATLAPKRRWHYTSRLTICQTGITSGPLIFRIPLDYTSCLAANGDLISWPMNLLHFTTEWLRNKPLSSTGRDPVTRAFISPFRHPVTSFCSRSITLAVSDYVVADRLLGFFPAINECNDTHRLPDTQG